MYFAEAFFAFECVLVVDAFTTRGMTMKLDYGAAEQRFQTDILESAIEHLERLKTMTCIMEAQLLDREPVLAELASNMVDEIDGVMDRIEVVRD